MNEPMDLPAPPDLAEQVLRMVTEIGELERAAYGDFSRGGATPADALYLAQRAAAPLRRELRASSKSCARRLRASAQTIMADDRTEVAHTILADQFLV